MAELIYVFLQSVCPPERGELGQTAKGRAEKCFGFRHSPYAEHRLARMCRRLPEHPHSGFTLLLPLANGFSALRPDMAN